MNSPFKQDIDDATIRQAQLGDMAACEIIYRRFQNPAYTLAYRLTQCPDQAADYLQEGLLKALSQIHQYQHQGPFWAWLRKVFINRCLELLRQNKRRNKLIVLHPELPDAVQEDYPDLREDLAKALAKLPAERRLVLWLFAVEGFSHREIAQMTGHSESYSKMQCFRAREYLQKHLANEQTADEQGENHHEYKR